MCDESDDNELMNAVLLELQIQIGVGKAAGTPVLEGNDVAHLRCELAADLATPGPILEGLMRPGCLLDGSDVLPGLVVALTVPMMQRIENAQPGLPRSIQDLQHVRNTIIRLCDSLQAVPELASFGNEVVVRIDHQECGDLLVICHGHANSLPFAEPPKRSRRGRPHAPPCCPQPQGGGPGGCDRLFGQPGLNSTPDPVCLSPTHLPRCGHRAPRRSRVPQAPFGKPRFREPTGRCHSCRIRQGLSAVALRLRGPAPGSRTWSKSARRMTGPLAP